MGAAASSEKGKEAAAKLQNTKVVVGQDGDKEPKGKAGDGGSSVPSKAPAPAANAGKMGPQPPGSVAPNKQRPKAKGANGAGGAESGGAGGGDVKKKKKETDEEKEKKKIQQEEASLAQMTAQQYKAYEKKMAEKKKKLQEQEEQSIEQQMAQQYKAFEAAQQQKGAAPGGGEGQKPKMTKEEQEEMSIDQMNLQQYKAYERKMAEQAEKEEAARALEEADAMMNQFAPPSKPKPKMTRLQSMKPPPGQKPKMESFYPDSGMSEDRNEVSEVVEGKIYLTNYRGAENVEELKKRGIRHIVCVNEQDNEHADKFRYFNIDTLEDQEDNDASPHFQSVKEFTDEALLSGGAVLFHCAAGISRSATMVIAYLMASHRMTLLEAFAVCYHHRRVTWPNRSFMMQLIAYEKKLQSKRGIKGKQLKPTITIEQWDSWSSSSAPE